MNTFSRLREIRNWVPISLFVLFVCIGALFLNFAVLRYLLILLFAASVGVLARLQLINRERLARRIFELNKLAYCDELTGLFNRRKIIELLTQSLNDNAAGSVLLLDLDGFKQVNDKYGHHVGDTVLIQLADRLRRMFNDGTQFARLGGDEFLVVADCSHEVSALISDVKRCLAKPLEIDGISVTVGASRNNIVPTA